MPKKQNPLKTDPTPSQKNETTPYKETYMPLNDAKIINDTEDDILPTSTSNQWRSTAALGVVIFCQTYLLVSVFPYSGFMSIFLIPNLTPETAGYYAGLIASSYMVGRAISSFTWGRIADTIGRKYAFHLSFLLSGLCSIWFGTATSIQMALLSRFSMGLGNGLLLCAKTAVSELAKGDEKLEARNMGLVMGMWGWGFLICPPISGGLSEPVKQYPDLLFVQRFEPFLSKYPFLLPNLISVFLCVAGSICVHLYVDETLPADKIKSVRFILKNTFEAMKQNISIGKTNTSSNNEEILPLRDAMTVKEDYSTSERTSETYALTNTDDSTSGATDQELDDGLMPHTESCTMLATSVGFDSSKAVLSPSSDDNVSNVVSTPKAKGNSKDLSAPVSASSIWAKDATRHHLIAYWISSYTSIIVDEAFPLFCIATHGGLNLTEAGIGKILSGAGLIFVIGQYFIYSMIMSRYGLFKSMVIGSLASAPITVFIPISLYLNNGQINNLSWSTYIFLCIVLGCKNIGGNVIFSSITIATNRTVASNHRASMNGLSMVGGSVAKALGPVSAGVLVSILLGSGVFSSILGAVVLFGAMSGFGVINVCYIYVVLRKYYNSDGSSLIMTKD